MVKICPVSTHKTNEHVSRMNALFTVIFVLAFVFTGQVMYLVLLFVDFLLRNINQGKLSPAIHINKYMVGILAFEPRMINAGPKIFAARVGFFLSGLSMLFGLFISFDAALVPTLILGIFSFLEMAFGFCVACRIYPYILPLNERIERWRH